MGLRDRLPFGGSSGAATEVSTVTVDEQLADEIHETAAEFGPVITIVPFKHEGGFEQNKAFFENVFEGDDPFAFEIVYWRGETRIGMRYAGADRSARRTLQMGAESCYHDADIGATPEPFLDIEPGDHVAVARTKLRDTAGRNYLKPIKNYKTNPHAFDIHPYDGVTSVMAGDGGGVDASVLVQVICKPATSLSDNDKENWHYGAGKLAKDLSSADTTETRWTAVLEGLAGEDDLDTTKEEYVSGQDTGAADTVADQRNQIGYHTNIRVIAASKSAESARERVRDTTNKYRNFYNAVHGQGFEPEYPDAVETLERAAGREYIDQQMPFSVTTLAGVGGPPMALNTPEVEYCYTRNDDGIPPGIPQFEQYDETGMSDEIQDWRAGEYERHEEDDVTESRSIRERLGRGGGE